MLIPRQEENNYFLLFKFNRPQFRRGISFFVKIECKKKKWASYQEIRRHTCSTQQFWIFSPLKKKNVPYNSRRVEQVTVDLDIFFFLQKRNKQQKKNKIIISYAFVIWYTTDNPFPVNDRVRDIVYGFLNIWAGALPYIIVWVWQSIFFLKYCFWSQWKTSVFRFYTLSLYILYIYIYYN